jgi:hypothetical protein
VPTIDLADAELQTAAMACRAMAYQDGERAQKIENWSLGAPTESTPRR